MIVLDTRTLFKKDSVIFPKIYEMMPADTGYERPRIILGTTDIFHNQTKAEGSMHYGESLFKPMEFDHSDVVIAKHIDLSCFMKA